MRNVLGVVTAVAVPLIIGCNAATAADELIVSIKTLGKAAIELRHAIDEAHNCAIVDRPWKHVQHGGENVEVPPAPPLLEIAFDPSAAPTDASFRVSVFDYSVGLPSRVGSADDHIYVNLNNERWHASGQSVAFTFSGDGLSGSLHAESLAPMSASKDDPRRINIDARWSCPQLDKRTD